MTLPRFEYYSPDSLRAGLDWLAAHHHEGVRLLAGGTDLLVSLRGKVIPDGHKPRCQDHRAGPWRARHSPIPTPKYLLALSRIPELRGISADSGRIRIGAMTTHTELERSPVIAEFLSGLREGAMQLGSPLCRNRGTYGGNLCNARPASDTAIPTLALEGKLVLASARGERVVAFNDFITAPGMTIIAQDEILKEIIFEMPASPRQSAYIKLANRKALEIAVVGAAAAVTLDGDLVTSAQIALGAVAAKPLQANDAAASLIAHALTDEAINIAAGIAAEQARPITDHRGGAEYRRAMVAVLVRRVLHRCRERAGQSLRVAI